MTMMKTLLLLTLMSVSLLLPINGKNVSFVAFYPENHFEPVISSDIVGESEYKFNYNPSYVELPGNGAGGLLVRCQNQTASNQTTPSVIAAVGRTTSTLTPFRYEMVTERRVILAPNSAQDAFGCEDPRVVYDARNRIYYLFYSAVSAEPVVESKLSLAVCQGGNPMDALCWQRRGPVFPDIAWSKSGAMLLRKVGQHYLFWGDSTNAPGISIARADSPSGPWRNTGELLIKVRPDCFDSHLVESGPQPMPLSDGSLLFIYNSAGADLVYKPGFVILDGDDPTRVLLRSECDDPLTTPMLPWEMGTPSLHNVPNVVFIEGIEPVNARLETDCFFVFYGGADSVVGVGRVCVHGLGK
jgi:predicted GH43/DUF377 family glycosyl hydrolase